MTANILFTSGFLTIIKYFSQTYTKNTRIMQKKWKKSSFSIFLISFLQFFHPKHFEMEKIKINESYLGIIPVPQFSSIFYKVFHFISRNFKFISLHFSVMLRIVFWVHFELHFEVDFTLFLQLTQICSNHNNPCQ